MKNKKKKGFTLVELIVVIAIIAILAAIAVPTTMIFVEKANISKEAQEMNIMTDVQGIIQSTFGADAKNKKGINLTDDTASTGSMHKLMQTLTIPESLGAIQYVVDGSSDAWEVTVKLYSANYGAKAKDGGVLEAKLQGTYTNAQIFNGGTPAKGTFTYTTSHWVSADKTGVGTAANTPKWQAA